MTISIRLNLTLASFLDAPKLYSIATLLLGLLGALVPKIKGEKKNTFFERGISLL
jgi:hypothetical protein